VQVSATCKSLRAMNKPKVAAASEALKLFPTEPQTTVALLQSLRVVGSKPDNVAAFLFDAGSYFPARFVGVALTSGLVGMEIGSSRPESAGDDSDEGSGGDPEGGGGATFEAARAGAGAAAGEDRPRSFAALLASRKAAQAYNRQLVLSYLQNFDFSDLSPVQALRALLVRTRMPREGRRIGTLLKLFADRYSECLRTAGPGKRLLYGFDLSTLAPEPAYLVVYASLVLNTDLRHTAIKHKMTKADFSSRNSRIPELQHIPKSFFEGIYDEVVIGGLPVSDTVSTAPAFSSTSAQREGPHPAAVAALRNLSLPAGGRPRDSSPRASSALAVSLQSAATSVSGAFAMTASRAAEAVSSVDWQGAATATGDAVSGAWRYLKAGWSSLGR
jgi:Sec7 domain